MYKKTTGDSTDLPVAPSAAVEEIAGFAPTELAERLLSLAKYVDHAYAPNTLRSWRACWRKWAAYCRRCSVPALPTTVDVIEAFLREAIDTGRKRATLDRYLATLAWVHRLAKLPNPIESSEGDMMWRALRRDARVPKEQKQKRAMSWADIEKILAGLDPQKPSDLRDGALLCTAYETLMRRSELVAMDVEHVKVSRDYDDSGNGTVKLPHSKTDQERQGMLRFVSKETLGRIAQWQKVSGIRSGALWRSIPPSFKPGAAPYVKRLGDWEIARIFKRLALRAGIEGGEDIAGHSTRIGATVDLDHAGFTGLQIARAGGWKTETMVLRYTRESKVKTGAMAQMQSQRRQSK